VKFRIKCDPRLFASGKERQEQTVCCPAAVVFGKAGHEEICLKQEPK